VGKVKQGHISRSQYGKRKDTYLLQFDGLQFLDDQRRNPPSHAGANSAKPVEGVTYMSAHLQKKFGKREANLLQFL